MIDAARIRRILSHNRRRVRALRPHFYYKILSLRGWLYRALREEGYPEYAESLRGVPLDELVEELRSRVLPPRSSAIAGRIILDAELLSGIDRLELYVEPRLPPEELLSRAVRLKGEELEFFREFAESVREYVPEHPEWAEESERCARATERYLRELREMLPVYRVVQTRQFYAYPDVRTRRSPVPFAFLSVRVFTRSPGDWPEDLLRSALDFLTYDPSAFPSLGWALASGSAYHVDGREVRRAEPEELEGEELDELRYVATFYRVRHGVAYVFREYAGWLYLEDGRWVIRPDRSHPRSPAEPSPGQLSLEEVVP